MLYDFHLSHEGPLLRGGHAGAAAPPRAGAAGGRARLHPGRLPPDTCAGGEGSCPWLLWRTLWRKLLCWYVMRYAAG